CYRDWSSDVCSSDLEGRHERPEGLEPVVQSTSAVSVELPAERGPRLARAWRSRSPCARSQTFKAARGSNRGYRNANRHGFHLVRSEERRVGKECRFL